MFVAWNVRLKRMMSDSWSRLAVICTGSCSIRTLHIPLRPPYLGDNSCWLTWLTRHKCRRLSFPNPSITLLPAKTLYVGRSLVYCVGIHLYLCSMTKIVGFSDKYSIFGQVVILLFNLLPLLNSDLLFELLLMRSMCFYNLVFFDLKPDWFLFLALSFLFRIVLQLILTIVLKLLC